ncbi:hypothetical protein ACJQWK_05197 [Exserohilum turcicum]|uniref:CFEM domain-containing protein n=1 Tax=Exserohilum turcicum (strain 28A) TaxID=671987 RepID=R0I943_EXST2|nr:uncharacterized protein SETTUDRAFT_165528 [Exserohilum turcica Et28A]EOA82020.1 hypothetical protein SETTUDRAFT_165528 [Exserohilum turcica Et28A]
MKTFTIASIVALASVASAQLDNIPQCALTCFIGPLAGDGCKDISDFACHCKKGDQLLSQVQPCAQGACSAADQQKAIAAVEATCKSVGVPITIPGASAAPSGDNAPKSSIPAASAASSASPSASASPSPSPSPSASPSGTSGGIMSIVTHSSMDSKVPSMTPTPTTTPSRSPAASSSASQFTGAAVQATHAAGIIGAAALAMLAL